MRLPQLVTQLLLDVEHPVLEAVRQVHVLRGVQVDGHAGVLVGPFGELLVLEDDLATELLCAGQLLQKKKFSYLSTKATSGVWRKLKNTIKLYGKQLFYKLFLGGTCE